MTSPWSTPADLRSQLDRLWQRGDLLRAQLTGEPGFPLRLTLRSPTSSQLADRFDDVRAWIATLSTTPHLRIDSRELNHRVLGAQRIPAGVWIDTLDDALAMLGKRSAAERFEQIIQQTRDAQPTLLDWLKRRPLQALELANVWPQLLAVVQWLQQHPHSAIYLRQVDIPSVHSKFIEAHRGVLGELLDLALSPEAINPGARGSSQFNARYGFLDKPPRIRFRLLDPLLTLLPTRPRPGQPTADISLDTATFAALDAPIRRVFITENETNFLAFPAAPHAIVIFGAGYGWDALAKADWLKQCAIHYWGDIDTHGFAILDQLRRQFAHVESFLMDRATLMAHETLWGCESKPITHDLPHLTRSERELFDDLRDNRIRTGLRLEQEHVGYRRVQAAVSALGKQDA
jgi:hypothetical protein